MAHPAQTDATGAGIETLITANQAYPRLERLFLDAQHSIEMGFRLFEPNTRLQSSEARAIGSTWVDLLRHTLNRGVTIELTVSDFDPIMQNEMHVQAWRFVRQGVGLNEMTDPGAAKLWIRTLLHPAQGGWMARLLFALSTRKRLHELVKAMNDGPDPARAAQLSPGLRPYLKIGNGRVSIKPAVLPHLFPATLHHKLAVFDGVHTYIGGLDLNNRRLDDTDHALAVQSTWQDVQLVLHDPKIAEAAQAFLAKMGPVTAGSVKPGPTHPSFLRTLARDRRNPIALAPKTVSRELLQAHLDQIATATRLIYLESQFFRDRELARALAKAARRAPDLTVIMLLPAAPDDVAFEQQSTLDARFGEYLQARSIRKVEKAFGDRFYVFSPAQTRPMQKEDLNIDRAEVYGAPLIYVHSKVSLFDDSTAIVSSANLNGRSLRWDSEAGVILHDSTDVAAVKQAVFRVWLGDGADDRFYDPATALRAWKTRAWDNANRAPEDRTGFLLPYPLGPARRLGQPVPGAPEDMV